MIKCVVRAGVPRSEHGGERLLGPIEEDEQRMEAEAVLVVRGGVFLFRVRRHERRVEVERYRLGCSSSLAGSFRASRGAVSIAGEPTRRRSPPGGRVRSHFTEELRLVAKDRQIREAVTAVEERHHQLGEHASRVVTTRPHVPALYRVRRRLRETQSVGQFSDEERARMANDTLAVRVTTTRCAARVAFTMKVPS